MAQNESSEQIGEEDLQQFSEKIEAWGRGLPPKDRALLQLLLARAQGADVSGYMAPGGLGLPSIGQASTAALQPLIRGGLQARVRGWVEAGDPWVQGA